tara:strand:- start:237 stop:467 length:231 start_codon:yes stop_codon:yes gene_type:complete
MNLQEYFEKNEWRPFTQKSQDICKRGGFTFLTLGKIVTGQRKASLDLAFRIEAATGGAVTAREIWKAQKLRQAKKH